MRGSHAPSLRTIVTRTLREDVAIERGSVILCACSGGADSTAMVHVLASLRATFGFDVRAHGVDHGLRPEAASELGHAREIATSVGVAFGVSKVDVGAGANLQARARIARYEALRAAATSAGAAFIATAHTSDDRAETVLLRLLRGSGARGLGVLPPRDGLLLRPLVRASRSDVLRHLERQRISFASDPSNLDTRFARVRVRLEILPALRRMSPRIDETLNALADELLGMRGVDDPLQSLGRRQRNQVRIALAKGRTGRVRVDDCKEVFVRLAEGGPVVIEARESHRRKR